MHFCLPEVVFRSIAAQFNLALVQLPELKSRDRDESRDIHLSPEAEHRHCAYRRALLAAFTTTRTGKG